MIAPFSYHFSVKELINKAIITDTLEKYHFNLFRTLLEKTSVFLGYSAWSDCISEGEDKENLKHRLQVYSHSKLSETESVEISNDDKILLKNTFTDFLNKFNWN